MLKIIKLNIFSILFLTNTYYELYFNILINKILNILNGFYQIYYFENSSFENQRRSQVRIFIKSRNFFFSLF